jgi:nitroreductase
MELLAAIRRRRTIRRFAQKPVPDELLKELLEAARMAPTGGNRQRHRYLVVRTPELVNKVFVLTAWAGAVKPRRNPELGKTTPTAFIALLPAKDGEKNLEADAGAAIQNLLLRAVDLGLGACWIGSFKRAETAALLGLPDTRQPVYLVALGWPSEDPVADDIPAAGDPTYYLDPNDRLHVPKFTVAALAEWK